MRAGLSSVTRGTLFLLIGTLCLVALNFVSRVVIVRSVSNDDWSAFAFALTLTGLLIAFGTLGLPSAVARSLPYAATDDERRAFVRGTLLWGGIAAVGSSAALFLAAPYIGAGLGAPEIGLALEFFTVGLGTSIVATLIAAIFQGYEDVTPNAVIVQIVNPGLFVAFLGVFLLLPGHHLTFLESLVGYAVASALTLALSVAYMVRRLPRVLPPGPRAAGALDRLMRFAIPLFVVGVMSSLTGNGDTLILGIFHPGEVGTYTASLTLARLLQVGVGAAAYIFLPVASKFLRQEDPAAISLTFTTVTKWMILFSLPLFMLFFFLPSESLLFVYGPNYASVTVPLEIVVAGAFATTLLGPGPTTQVAFGDTRLLAYNAMIAGVADVAIAFLLVPTYGYVGAAIAWSVAGTLYSVLSIVELAVAKGLHPFRHHFVVPLLASAVPVGLALALLHPRVSIWWLPPIGLAIAGAFVALVLVTRSVDAGDRLLLESVEGLLGRPIPLVRRIGKLVRRERFD